MCILMYLNSLRTKVSDNFIKPMYLINSVLYLQPMYDSFYESFTLNRC